MVLIKKQAKSGFSLIELMIAITIMALIGGVAGTYIWNYVKRARVDRAKRDLKGIQNAINLYKMDIKTLPASMRDLVRRPSEPSVAGKWQEGGYLGKDKKVPRDPWGNKYQYRPESEGENPYVLFSYGPKGRKAPRVERISVWDVE